MIKRWMQALFFSCALTVATTSCAQSRPVNRTADVTAMLTRELPLGMSRRIVLTKLDSLVIPHTALDSTGTVVRALVRNTSQSAVAVGSLQVLLHFGPDSTLLRREFKELFVAP